VTSPSKTERPAAGQVSSMADLMAPPSALAPPQLRPDPPTPPQPIVSTLNFAQPPVQPQPERRAQSQASSYWSVSEITEFPALLRAFGTDWTAIANHMGSKTPVMVGFFVTYEAVYMCVKRLTGSVTFRLRTTL